MLVVQNGHMKAPGCTRFGNVLCGVSRARARSALHDALPPILSCNEETAAVYAMHLEACAAAYSMNDYASYMSMMSRVVFNLKSNGEYIVTSYPVSAVCRVSHKRLHAETVHAQRDAAVELRLEALMVKVKDEMERMSQVASSVQADTGIKCSKCYNTKDIQKSLAQLRRADEGMATQCMCPCGHTWILAS